jgi:hypothetical protein
MVPRTVASVGQTPFSVGCWIWYCAFCSAAGWILSALHQLNPAGYLAAFAVAAAVGIVVLRKSRRSLCPRRTWFKQRQRFRRGWPLAFLILAGMAIAGGVFHTPSNFDGLAYRTPRVLHWLADHRWHWINTDFARVNVRACGFEWMTAPMIALMKTDRWTFLINAVCFALLPGRVFSLLRGLGASGKMARTWMWLLPTGYCYLVQAGSIGNDLYGGFFAIATIEFALRACRSGSVVDLWLSILAVGLATGGKAFNILIGLPWAVAVLPVLPLLFKRWISSGLVIALGLLASFIPTALLNFHYCGDWSGQAAEHVSAINTGARFLHIVVNSLLLLLHNFAPPIFPLSGAWNDFMTRSIPPDFAATLHHHFEPDGAGFKLGEMQVEEMAALGFGVSVLLVLFAVFRLAKKQTQLGYGPVIQSARELLTVGQEHEIAYRSFLPAPVPHALFVILGTWVAVLYFMSVAGLNCPGRYLAVFYPMLLAPLFAGPFTARLPFRQVWWKWSCAAVFLIASLLLIVSPARPLWPAVPLLRNLDAEHSSNNLLRRAWTVYSVYGSRADAFRSAREVLPAEANPLGFVTSDDPETSLWRPFGSRRIYHIRATETREEIEKRGIKYALVNSVVLKNRQISIEEWLSRTGATVVRPLKLELRASVGPTDWYLVKWGA